MADPVSQDTHEVEEMLERMRPVPSAGFRGELRRHLLAGHAVAARPPRLHLLIAGYAVSGALLLVVAVVGLVGVGPLAA